MSSGGICAIRNVAHMGNVGSVWEMLPYFIYICMGTEKTVRLFFCCTFCALQLPHEKFKCITISAMASWSHIFVQFLPCVLKEKLSIRVHLSQHAFFDQPSKLGVDGSSAARLWFLWHWDHALKRATWWPSGAITWSYSICKLKNTNLICKLKYSKAHSKY